METPLLVCLLLSADISTGYCRAFEIGQGLPLPLPDARMDLPGSSFAAIPAADTGNWAAEYKVRRIDNGRQETVNRRQLIE